MAKAIRKNRKRVAPATVEIAEALKDRTQGDIALQRLREHIDSAIGNAAGVMAREAIACVVGTNRDPEDAAKDEVLLAKEVTDGVMALAFANWKIEQEKKKKKPVK